MFFDRRGHGEVRVGQFPGQRPINVEQIGSILDQFQTAKVRIEGFLKTLPFWRRKLLTNAVHHRGVELSVVPHQSAEIRVDEGDVRHVVGLLERLHRRVETFETLAKQIFDFLNNNNSKVRPTKIPLAHFRRFVIEILHRLGATVHPVNAHLIANVGEPFGQ